MVQRQGSKLVLIAIRAVLLAAAAGSLAMALILAHGTKPTPVREQAAMSYLCPMHPEVASAGPADCPICGMALESTSARRGTATDKAWFSLPSGATPVAYREMGRATTHASPQDMRVLAWAEDKDRARALFYIDQIALLGPEEGAEFTPTVRGSGVPALIPLRRKLEAPVKWDDKTALVAFRPLKGARLVPGQAGSIKLAARFRKGLVVPASSVIQSPTGPYVLMVGDDRRTLTPQAIAIGSTTYGLTALLSGLEEGKRVVAARTFLFDAERHLAARMSP